MKNVFNILAALILSWNLWSCKEDHDEVNALGVNGIMKEYLSSKIDSVVSIQFSSLAPNRGISRIDVRNPYGLTWGTAYLNNGQGKITLPRDSFELYALKNSGSYVLSSANEIMIPGIHFVAPEEPRMSSMTTVRLQPSANIELLTDIVLEDGRDSTKNVGTLTTSDAPVYFKFSTISAQIDNPDFSLDEFKITLYSQNTGGTVCESRPYNIKGDTIMFLGSDYSANDKVSLKINYKMGKYSDEVTSTAYTVSTWKFQNVLNERTLSPTGNTYFNLANGWGATEEPTAPHIKFNGNGSFSIFGNSDTTAVAAKITGYTFANREVKKAIDKFEKAEKTDTYNNPAPNTCIAIRFQYLNAKGELISTFGVLQIVSIENIGTNNEIITFNYIYKPQTY